MGLSASIVVTAVGAVLLWTVPGTVAGLSLATIGAVLFIVGLVGIVLAAAYWSSWGGFGFGDHASPNDRR